MGYIRHHAILVTSWDEALIEKAHAAAADCGCSVTNITEPAMNSYRTFVVVPDGSKEGWDESNRGDSARLMFILWLNDQAYEDGSSAIDWCLVMYGDDDGDLSIGNATTGASIAKAVAS